ncbi:hypothetical protein F5880DRAFT_1510529 [Lentinula raphanica]|nr:hypothetical protein F5880DRAFT_1510529 [Lentinula raphanica]
MYAYAGAFLGFKLELRGGGTKHSRFIPEPEAVSNFNPRFGSEPPSLKGFKPVREDTAIYIAATQREREKRLRERGRERERERERESRVESSVDTRNEERQVGGKNEEGGSRNGFHVEAVDWADRNDSSVPAQRLSLPTISSRIRKGLPTFSHSSKKRCLARSVPLVTFARLVVPSWDLIDIDNSSFGWSPDGAVHLLRPEKENIQYRTSTNHFYHFEFGLTKCCTGSDSLQRAR